MNPKFLPIIGRIFPGSFWALLITIFAIFDAAQAFASKNDFGYERTWTLEDGSKLEGEFFIELGGIAYFKAPKNKIWSIPVKRFTPDQIEWINAHSEDGKSPVLWNESESPMAKATIGQTVITNSDGAFTQFEPGNRIEPEIYVLYLGASWCGPCRSFVKSLKIWYDEFSRHGIKNFEVFFVSSDHSRPAFERYVSSEAMTWPALKFRKRYPSSIRKYQHNSIPGMVITDRQGNILSDAHSREGYRGAYTVLDDLKRILFTTNPQNPLTLRVYHQKIRDGYERSHQDQNKSPQPVYIFIEEKIQQQLQGLDVTLELTIVPSGRVTSAKITESNLPDLNSTVEEIALSWLFLPKLENGRPVESRVRFPLKIGGGGD